MRLLEIDVFDDYFLDYPRTKNKLTHLTKVKINKPEQPGATMAENNQIATRN